jgi:hypothetical protein
LQYRGHGLARQSHRSTKQGFEGRTQSVDMGDGVPATGPGEGQSLEAGAAEGLVHSDGGAHQRFLAL